VSVALKVRLAFLTRQDPRVYAESKVCAERRAIAARRAIGEHPEHVGHREIFPQPLRSQGKLSRRTLQLSEKKF